MVQSVSYLHIKPLAPYRPENGQGTTSLVPFDALLSSETAAGLQDSSVSTDSTAKDDASTDTTQNSSESTAVQNTSDDKVIYKDPLTGKTFTYIDVAKETSYASSSKSTVSVDSMKKTKYDEYFKKAAQRYGVSESLLKAIAKAESNFNPNDVSSTGAVGIMQLMPETAKSLGVKNSYDPEQNIMGGAKCIKQKLKEFHGDVSLALAAYNAGSGAVKRSGGVPSYCKSYVSKVLSYKEAFETAVAVG